MFKTNSLTPTDQTTDGTQHRDTNSMPSPSAAVPELFERLGVGGMGEVYRYGDDALQRDLAIKVIKAELRGDADAELRFLREARLTGALEHPSIVPIHHLGRLADGRLCYTMKLVRGRTLSELLRGDSEGSERLPSLLAVVEKVCQAMAFAHSRGVIHRDLKPSNVMVGEFGEVQVMDWGLAKELARNEVAAACVPMVEMETVAQAEEGAELSRAGAALGTPAYMPPEQAAGDWDIVDERADVFALGAILCEMLTGRPPYQGGSRDDLLRRARRGDVAESLTQLEQCGADGVLVQLCRECLAAERELRPRHAGVVAERLASYQAEVRERLRQAELERARVEVKALEERKRRRLQAALALAALVLLLGGAAVWWQGQKKQADDQRNAAARQKEADGEASQVMDEARLLSNRARETPLDAPGYDKAVLAAARAGDVARAGGASLEVRRKTEELFEELQHDAEAAAKDRRFLARLLEASSPREGSTYGRNNKGLRIALAEPTAEEQFASAFRDWGLDVEGALAAEAVERLKARPKPVVMEIIAALDEWADQLRLSKRPEVAKRVAELAAAWDVEPGSLQRELREILTRERLPLERALGVLSRAMRPVPVPAAVPVGKDCLRLRQMAERVDVSAEPVLGLLTLTRALRRAGEEASAEKLLRAALRARPSEVVLYHSLGNMLKNQQPPQWREAAECYAVARGLRPELGLTLAVALLQSGREREGVDLLDWLIKERPDNPHLYFYRGIALREMGDLDGAITCLKKTVALEPRHAKAHTNLGVALHEKNDLDGAIACYRKALEIDPTLTFTHNNLGNALHEKEDRSGAIARYREAIALNPKFPEAHYNLGMALKSKGDLDGAIACYRTALALNPRYAKAYNNLGNALREKGDLDDAITCLTKVIALFPKYSYPYTNLGLTLYEKHDLDGAIANYKKGISLEPRLPQTHYNLGNALREKGDLDDAVASYKQAISLDPKYAKAWSACGGVLETQGRYAEARDATRHALTLLPSSQPQQRLAAQQLQRCEQALMLEGKLPAILEDTVSPAGPDEALTLARVCQQQKKRYDVAARLYADAFAAEPKLAADLEQQPRYDAARSAVRAASGQGENIRSQPDKVTTMFRLWALRWLRDDLTAYVQRIAQNNSADKEAWQRLARWRRDPDLASVRDPQELDRLPENERAAWQALWRNVDELANQERPPQEGGKAHAPQARFDPRLEN